MKNYRVAIYDLKNNSCLSPILSYDKAIDYFALAIKIFVMFNMFGYAVHLHAVKGNGELYVEKIFYYSEEGGYND